MSPPSQHWWLCMLCKKEKLEWVRVSHQQSEVVSHRSIWVSPSQKICNSQKESDKVIFGSQIQSDDIFFVKLYFGVSSMWPKQKSMVMQLWYWLHNAIQSIHDSPTFLWCAFVTKAEVVMPRLGSKWLSQPSWAILSRAEPLNWLITKTGLARLTS